MKVLLIGHLSETTAKLHTVLSNRDLQVFHIPPNQLAEDLRTPEAADVLLFAHKLKHEELKASLENLRESGISSPAIILSDHKNLKDELRKLGPLSVIASDSSFETLLQEVSAAGLKKTERTIKTLGPLSMNLLEQSAILYGQDLNLTETEFNLLLALADRPGKVVSNTRILSSVWGLQHDPQSNRVAVYMKKLRTKIPEDMIENQRGVGYRLVINDTE